MPAATFDRDIWRKRAWDRFQRSVRGSRQPARGAEHQWYRDVICIDALSSVVSWCSSRGLEVVFAKRPNGLYDPQGKVIYISARASPEKQLHYLLHECGHHLIGMEELNMRFGMGYPRLGDPEVNRTLQHKVACLEEEFEAWHRGWRLSERLRLTIDRQAFDVTRISCLKTYIRWSAKLGK